MGDRHEQSAVATVQRLARNLVARPRLLARLDARTPLTVLRAPVGFGKSTLVAQWLAGRDPSRDPTTDPTTDPSTETVASLRLRRDPGDTDSFWVRVIDALTDAGLPQPSLSQHRSPQALAERMLATSGPLLLVLDGFENVAGAETDQAMLDVLWHTPQLRLIVCLRSHRYFAAEQFLDMDATVVGAHDLLFTVRETADLFAAVGLDMTPAQAEAIHAETGGWPEPTRALVLRLRDSTERADVPGIAGVIAADYLRRRLLPQTCRPERIEFALVTSLPDEFGAEVAQLLSDDGSAKSHLEWLEGEGVLLAESRDGEPVYRWPGAARRALAAELRRRVPQRLPELHARLARWYRDGAQPGPALHHAVRAKDWPLVVEVIDAGWRRLLIAHREQLHEAFNAAPLGVIAASPRALAVRDMRLQMPDDRILAAAPLPAEPDKLAELGGSARAAEILDTGLAVLIALRRRGRFDHARAYGDRLLDLAATAQVTRTEQVADLVPNVHLVAGATRLMADDPAGALDPLQRAYDTAGDDPFDYVEADAAGTLALVHAVIGEPRQAAIWLRRHERAPAPSTWLEPDVRATASAARLLIALDGLDLDLDLDQAATSSDSITDRIRTNELWAFFAYAHAQHALHAGTALDALDLIRRARVTHHRWLDHGAAARALLACAEADLLIALGRGNQAHAVVHGPCADHPLLRVGQARLALLAGDPAAAIRLATDSGWTQVATPRHRVEMLLVHAVAAHRTGDLPAAADSLRRAIDSARATGARHAFATVPRDELDRLAAHLPGTAELVTGPDLFPSRVTLIQLTERERQVLAKLAAGLTLQQAADALVVSYNTVKTQQRSLYQKLDADSRADALARARQWGLLDG